MATGLPVMEQATIRTTRKSFCLLSAVKRISMRFGVIAPTLGIALLWAGCIGIPEQGTESDAEPFPEIWSCEHADLHGESCKPLNLPPLPQSISSDWKCIDKIGNQDAYVHFYEHKSTSRLGILVETGAPETSLGVLRFVSPEPKEYAVTIDGHGFLKTDFQAEGYLDFTIGTYAGTIYSSYAPVSNLTWELVHVQHSVTPWLQYHAISEDGAHGVISTMAQSTVNGKTSWVPTSHTIVSEGGTQEIEVRTVPILRATVQHPLPDTALLPTSNC